MSESADRKLSPDQFLRIAAGLADKCCRITGLESSGWVKNLLNLIGGSFIGAGLTIVLATITLYEINMLKIQGVANRMGVLLHNLDADADQLNAGIDAADSKRVATVAKAAGVVASANQTLGDIDGVLSALDAASNGAPAEATALPPAGPYPTYP